MKLFHVSQNLVDALRLILDLFFCLKTITKGLTMFGETVASSLTGKHPPTTKKEVPVLDNGKTPGIVTIIDIQNVGEGVVSENHLISKESFHCF